MNKFGYILLLFICIVSLAGCTKEKKYTENEKGETFYKDSVTEYSITQYVTPLESCMGFDEEKSYFVCSEQAKDEEERTEQNFKNDAEGIFCLYSENERHDVVKLIDLPGYPIALHVSTYTGETSIAIELLEKGKNYIYEYDSMGNVMQKITLSDDVNSVLEIVKMQNGNFVLNCCDTIYVMDSEGNVVADISCHDGTFRHILYQRDDLLYSIICDSTGEFLYAEINLDKYILKSEMKLKDVSEVYYCVSQEGIIFCNKEGIYTFDSDLNRFVMCVDCQKAGILCDQIRTMCYLNGEIQILSWDSHKAAKKIEKLVLKSGVSMAEQKAVTEKEVKVCVAQLAGETNEYLERLAVEYNKEYPEIRIEVEYVPSDNLSMRLLSNQCPDLVYLMIDQEIDKYQRNGYLADLLPMMAESQIEKYGGLTNGFLQSFAYQGGLYAIPEYLQIYTICYVDGDIQEDGYGWNVDEYLTWLENHANVKNYYFSKSAQVSGIILGNLEAYVQVESKECYFDTDDFKNILRRLKEIELDHDNTSPDSLDWGEDYIYGPSYPKLQVWADFQSYLNSPVRIKGFPNDNGKRVTFLSGQSNYVIPSNAENKKEAFEFMEYVLLNAQYYLDDEIKNGNVTDGSLYVIDELLKKDMQHCVGTGNRAKFIAGEKISYEYVVTKEMQEDFLDAFQNAERIDDFRRQIMNIVVEEALHYFDNGTDLESTCKAIQNRVNIFLQENG